MNKSVQQGAALVTGGKRDRCNYEPALLDNVKPGMTAFEEEMFGPPIYKQEWFQQYRNRKNLFKTKSAGRRNID